MAGGVKFGKPRERLWVVVWWPHCRGCRQMRNINTDRSTELDYIAGVNNILVRWEDVCLVSVFQPVFW